MPVQDKVSKVMPRLLKGGLIGLGALVVSTLAIQASDLVRGIEGYLPGLVSEQTGVCGGGAVLIQLAGKSLCVDAYESSPAEKCPSPVTNSPADTSLNLLNTDCQPVSGPGLLPWRFVSLTEAQQLCARSGKRLSSAAEWYKISLSLNQQKSCVVDAAEAKPTGANDCRTEAGVHDLVGNVWEWVDETVTDGRWEDRAIPDDGYVLQVDSNGVVLETGDTPDPLFGSDYAWTNTNGVFGMIRGGFYGAEDDAGIFAQNLAIPFDLRTSGIGFRCVRDL